MLNLYWGAASSQRVNEINDIDVFFLKYYEISILYNEKIKKYHDQKIEKREFAMGDLVLLFNSKLWLFHGKTNSKWNGPLKVTQVFPHGELELEKKGTGFKVNGQMIKVYMGKLDSVQEVIETYYP
nr:uncharacterized protein LOC101268311 [Solanum lycopersicum]